MNDPGVVRIATRASRLAMWQASHVAAALGDVDTRFISITTAGDRIIDQPLAKIGGKGLFIKELEHALLDGRADIAVHSIKDVPAELPEGLVIGAILARGDPRDALVSANGGGIAQLPQGGRVGTSSLRRRSQLLAARPDLMVEDLRGNVPTRLQRLEEGRFDAIVLASAGLRRLELFDRRCAPLPLTTMLPAVGQGAIAIECRADDDAVLACIAALHCERTAICVRCERAMNAALGGSCQIPIAGYAELSGDRVALQGLVASADGREVIRHAASGPGSEAEQLGAETAARLLADGADRILATLDPDTAARAQT